MADMWNQLHRRRSKRKVNAMASVMLAIIAVIVLAAGVQAYKRNKRRAQVMIFIGLVLTAFSLKALYDARLKTV